MLSKRKRKKDDGSKKDVKYKGVTKDGSRFKARIRIDGKQENIGTFVTPKEAAEAHDRARIQAGHPISKLNFLDQVPKFYKPKKKKLSSKNTTGFRGVRKNRHRFRASIALMANNITLVCLARQRRLPLRTISPLSKQNIQDLV